MKDRTLTSRPEGLEPRKEQEPVMEQPMRPDIAVVEDHDTAVQVVQEPVLEMPVSPPQQQQEPENPEHGTGHRQGQSRNG